MQQFIRNRFTELAGIGLIAFGLFLAVSFITYNPFDPSIHVSSNAKVSNAAGIAGAYISVPLLELFGLGVAALIIIPIMWGYKGMKKAWPKQLWLRGSVWLISLPLLSAALLFTDNLFATPDDWPTESLVGLVGLRISAALIPYLTEAGFYAAITTSALASLAYATGMSLQEWGRLFAGAWGAIVSVKYYSIAAYYGAHQFIRRIIQPSAGKISLPKRAVKKPAEEAKPSKRVVNTKRKETAKKQVQTSLDLAPGEYTLPSVEMLTAPPKRKASQSESALSQNAELLEKVLTDFGITGDIVEVQTGPVVTLYVLEPAPGTKSSRVIGLADDIARSMSAISARIAVIPGRNAIGIELPNTSRETVYLRELLEDKGYEDKKLNLTLSLGKDIGGNATFMDLAKMPHVLVAGTTGSGKSVGVNAMILSLLYKFTPDQCKFIMIDPKMLELSVYDDIPHLLCPVVTEPGKAVVALKWAVKEMENRYRLMSNLNVRNISNYNQKLEEATRAGKTLTQTIQTGFNPDTGEPTMETVDLDMSPLPYIVVIVDEMADLMLVAGKDVESSIQRLAQMARAAGIHLIMATQRPSVDVITGVIKANFPTRISYQVTSRIDSRTILGEQGAEQLLGMGDMLYMAGGGQVTRVHGAFVDDAEVESIVQFLKTQGDPTYIEDVTQSDEELDLGGEGGGEKDALYDEAVAIVIRDNKASTSYIQRSLKIGYNRAANIIEQMERDGLVSAANHVGKREILVKEHA